MLATHLTPTLAIRELPADLETPVSVYLKLAGHGPSFLLESVTGGEQVARYSFIGIHPRAAYVLRGRSLETHVPGKPVEITNLPEDTDPLDALRAQIAPYISPVEFIETSGGHSTNGASIPGLPRFAGGLVGYLGYDTVRFFEPTVGNAPHHHLPDAIFLHADTLIAFDHAYGKLILIANQQEASQQEASQQVNKSANQQTNKPTNGQNGNTQSPISNYPITSLSPESQLNALEAALTSPLPSVSSSPLPLFSPAPLRSNMTREQYTAAVRKAKEHIAAGDVFQVVPSQRFSRETTAQPFEIYRTLRRLNPSPYMFFFDFGNLASGQHPEHNNGSILSGGFAKSKDADYAQPLYLIGASPEMHVRYADGIASIRPIAGTRPRGQTSADDHTLERDLLADPKERAEHVMLVDLARNDLGRVCKYGTVRVSEQMVIERYSHVMHIVSHVDGELRPGLDAFDLVRATFPAGTVSGAPKIRAMQIIRDLEPEPRGVYAGAVGYFGYDGNADTCLAIRTLVMQGQTVHIQAGAGIVADSDPELEYEETVNKAKAIAVAIELAEKLKVEG